MLSLRPLPAVARDRYMLEVLHSRYAYTGDLSSVPLALVQVLSDYAAGIPKDIEYLLDALISAGAVRFEVDSEDGAKVVRCASLAELKAVPPPPKLRGSLLQQFDSLPGQLQRLLKTLAPLPAFSLGILGALPLPADILKRTDALIASAVAEGILDEVRPVPADVLAADPGARKAWGWLQLLMRDELLGALLNSERQLVEAQLDELRAFHARQARASAGVRKSNSSKRDSSIGSFSAKGARRPTAARTSVTGHEERVSRANGRRLSHEELDTIDGLRLALEHERERRLNAESEVAVLRRNARRRSLLPLRSARAPSSDTSSEATVTSSACILL